MIKPSGSEYTAVYQQITQRDALQHTLQEACLAGMLIDILELACLIKKEEEQRNEKKINDGNLSGKYKIFVTFGNKWAPSAGSRNTSAT